MNNIFKPKTENEISKVMKRAECKNCNDWGWISGFEDDRYVAALIKLKFHDDTSDIFQGHFRISEDNNEGEIKEIIKKSVLTGWVKDPKVIIQKISCKYKEVNKAIFHNFKN